jgi:hypothetical protein
MLSIKQRILRLVERAGYHIIKVAEDGQRERLIAELEAELDLQRDRVLALTQKLAGADRDFRLGRARDARELEAARAENWELRMHAAKLQQELDKIEQARAELLVDR